VSQHVQILFPWLSQTLLDVALVEQEEDLKQCATLSMPGMLYFQDQCYRYSLLLLLLLLVVLVLPPVLHVVLVLPLVLCYRRSPHHSFRMLLLPHKFRYFHGCTTDSAPVIS